MAERTVQHLAREFAGEFYDFVRSAGEAGEKYVSVRWGGRTLQNIDAWAFAKSFPTVKDYLAGRRWGRMIRHADGSVFWQPTGTWSPDTPGWLYFIKMARAAEVAMLRPDSGISDYLKEKIFDSVIEDRQQQARMEELGIKPVNIPQRTRPFN